MQYETMKSRFVRYVDLLMHNFIVLSYTSKRLATLLLTLSTTADYESCM